MNLLSVFEASKEIGDKVLYKNITFGIDDDDKIAIIGVNGCGKSTLLNLIGCLDHPTSGRVLIGDADVVLDGAPAVRAIVTRLPEA